MQLATGAGGEMHGGRARLWANKPAMAVNGNLPALKI
jgi:hypothetical protein